MLADAAVALDQSMAPVWQRMNATFKSGKTRSFEWRLEQLKAMKRMMLESEQAILQATTADMGRPEYETIVSEVGASLTEIEAAEKNLKAWMAPEKVPTPLLLQPGDSRIERVPKGVVLILGPWNFPINLVVVPAVAAIAAGNCVVIKPSEVAPRCAEVIKQMMEQYLDPEAVSVVLGGVPETTALLKLRWDHIMYTGNGSIARIVMEAAAKHLTPVTLELGGKSPVVVDKGLSQSQLKTACRRILWPGGFMNDGQICVSPDYVLVHKDAEKQLLDMLRECMTQFYPEGTNTSNLGRIVNHRHWDRVQNLIATSGGEKVIGGQVPEDRDKCYIPPTVVSRPRPDAPIMSEEIFGPVFSVLPVEDLHEAVAFINARETPLALYVFSPSRERAEQVVSGTLSGGVCINDVMMQLANPNLPFGGLGASGFGRYHGKHGFDEFTHPRSVLFRRFWPQLDVFPPYTEEKVSLIRRVQFGPLLPPAIKKAAAAAAVGAVGVGAFLLRSRL